MVMQAIVTCGKTCGCALRTLRTRGHSRHSLHFEHRERADHAPPRAVWLRRCAALQRKYGWRTASRLPVERSKSNSHANSAPPRHRSRHMTWRT